MGNKVFTKQLTVLVLGAAIVFLSACSELELPDTVASETTQTTEQTTEQETSLAAPTTVEQSATAIEPQEPEATPTPVNPTTTQPTPASPTPASPTPATPTPATPTTVEPITTQPTVTEPLSTPITEPVVEPVAETQTPPITSEPVTEPVSTTATPEQPTSTPEPEPTSTPAPEPTQEPAQQSSIWQPKPGTTWQWQLTGNLDISLDVDMYDIDLFDTKQSIIDQLHADNRIVICYFSAGSLEPWRSDVDALPSEVIGKKMSGWDEYWLDISKIDKLADIMKARLDLAVEKGCDGVEPDNIDAYQNDSGFPLTGQDQLNYNKFLAEEAHKRGLSIGLKNDLGQAAELEPYFDWALNESCYQYNECHLLLPFIENNKAVFGVEYSASTSQFCGLVNDLNFDFLKKEYNLSAFSIPCR